MGRYRIVFVSFDMLLLPPDQPITPSSRTFLNRFRRRVQPQLSVEQLETRLEQVEFIIQPESDSEAMGLSSSKETIGEFEDWSPSTLEVRYATVILARVFPPELVLIILDEAEYWPLKRYTMKRPVIVRSVGPMMGLRILRTESLSGGTSISSIKRITVTTVSRDQGFSGDRQHHGTREATHSWFEAVLLRRNPDVPPLEEEEEEKYDEDPSPEDEIELHRVEVVRNLHAVIEYESFSKEFIAGDEMADLARRGDHIEVWAYAHYPAWTNDVNSAKIEVEYMI